MNEEIDVLFWRRRRALAAYYFILKRRKKSVYRSVGTCELFKFRQQQGAYHNLVQEMRTKDSKKFKNYHRMSVQDFDFLLKKVSSFIDKTYYARKPVSPGEMLSATLRYLAAGVSMRSISYTYRLGLSTVSYIIKDTCGAIWAALHEEYLPTPTEEIWKSIARDFERKWNFPNCVGAMDGKHIRIQAPPHKGSDDFNYKDFFSIVLLAVCDADYIFTAVDIGAKGRQSDGGIFRNSAFGKNFFSNSLDLPQPRKLCNDQEPVTYFFVADSAFPFGVNLMRPYPGSFIPQNERIFNYRLSRARRVIENTFGVLVSQWRILERIIIAKLETIEKMICAIVCLHNFLRKLDANKKSDNLKYCPSTYIDRETETGEVIPGEWRARLPEGLASVRRMGGNAYSRGASSMRSFLADYFVHIAPIAPQWSK